MRVTVISLHYAPEPSGNAPYVTDLALGLREIGYAVTVVTAHPFYPQWRRYQGYGPERTSATEGGVTVVRRRHFIPRQMNLITRALSEMSAGVQALREGLHDPDVVLLLSPALFHAVLVSSRLRGRNSVPWVVWVQDLYSLGARETGLGGALTARLLRTIESALLRASDAVISIHDRFTRAIIQDMRVDPNRIETIRNWTHLPTAVHPPSRRDELGWDESDFVVLHAGNQGVKQGLDHVVQAAKLADQQSLPIRFVLLGDGNQREHLERLAQGVSRIQFIDPLPDSAFRGAMSASDVLLVNELPTLREMSVPSKLTSYFSAERPVIAATDSSSVTAEEIERSGGGVVVAPGDPQALLDAVMQLHADPQRAQALGASGLTYRMVELEREPAIQRFRDVIERVTLSASLHK